MKTLAIETSCDETSIAVIEDGRKILSNIISTQIETHKKFGGVVPEIASRMHVEVISQILKNALEDANIGLNDIDFISVTEGPGLVGALLVGMSFAKALSYSLDIPLIGVNHIKGHICANYISHKNLEPPFIALVISGGHTYLVDVTGYDEYKVIGRTRDDAVGEAFDKVARALGLPYPGGPMIDKLSKVGNPEAINFPRVYLEVNSYDFSFSGLKTAILNYLNQMKQKNETITIEDVAASFQMAVIDVLSEKTFRLLNETKRNKLAIAGGVAANSGIRDIFTKKALEKGIELFIPDMNLCTDNAAMIGSAGYYSYISGKKSTLGLKVDANLSL
ncbi:tRNA (adenosine(37)-N6)-threonylcarbamoyltransferase complex transferase subunit TsaD [Soehngenia longivitae]|uniref:tRNA N6-adenosine threonylcarbamoyltransferase n=1 Tax=Soehngenia longivitae TaxID=2562294 RepID=A0A4Z0DA27_9FIRM|nr:tRNA (adenosine(37)-N6)-threonylcarbamoyltransferase complex transferase subunit TsaD [Soehngenia longivitae]TFZ41734.1 tRNA (adenosine(37)-N6)-threonylcarbamoyltransferase complex transferase subunit TsaD [Soehngenia longivitae]